MNEDWLHKVHDRMTDYEIDEPENLWDTIESKRTHTPSAHNSRKNPVIMIWVKRIMAAAAMIAVLISLSVYITHTNYITDTQSLSSVKDKSFRVNASGIHETEKAGQPVSLAEKISVEKKSTNTISGVIQSETSIEPLAPTVLKENESISEREQPNTSGSISESADDLAGKKDSPEKVLQISRSDNKYMASILPKNSKQVNNISVSFYSSGGTGSLSNTNSKGDTFISSIGPDDSDWEDNPMLGILVFNQGKDIQTDIRHRLPIRAGVSFTYNFNERFGIESGVSYTNLTSDIKQGSDSHYFTGEQKLHYIGIPLNLKYRVFSWQRFDLYVSTGVLAEKCVSAKLDKEFILDHQNKSSKTEEISEKPMQWSVNASLGVQCNLIKSMGLFVEPGVSYHFNDGTDIQTIYKDKPLNFNLNMGVRFTFGK